MSDLFTRLVARTLGKAPVAHPLMRSSYAEGGSFEIEASPLTLGDSPMDNGEAPTSPPADGSLVEGIPRTREVRHPPRRDDHPPEGIFPANEEASETLQSNKLMPSVPVSPRRIDESQPKPERFAADFKERPSEQTWQVEPRQDTLSSPNLILPSASTASLTPRTPPDFSSQVPDPVSPPPRLVDTRSMPALSSPSMARPATAEMEPITDISETPDITPRASQPSYPGENVFWEPLNPRVRDTLRERAAPETPPEIHVTIGRVEVRAISQPPAPTRQVPRPRTPSLSLDDYLKQRNENGK